MNKKNNNEEVNINISNEIQKMAEYVSDIWNLDNTRILSFLNGVNIAISNDYKYQIDQFDISRSVLDLLDKREEQLSNKMFTMIDSFCLFGRSVMRVSLDTTRGYDFEKKHKEYLSKSLDKDCFKNAKLKGWKGKLDYELLEENEDNFNFEKYKGIRIRSATHPSFGEAVMPLNIAYANDRHGYGIKKLLEWACMTHLIELVAMKNKEELNLDMKNLFATFEHNYKDNLSQPIYVVNLEKGLKSNIGLRIAEIVKKDDYNNGDTPEEFDRKVEIYGNVKPITEDEEQKLVSENAARLLSQLARKVRKP